MIGSVTLVEAGMRDGFQSVEPFIPTATKIEILNGLYAAGLRRIEVTSFVSPTALPQLADAAEVLSAAHALPGCDPQVLVPSVRQAERALAAGASHLAFVLSVSEAHNQSNVRRSPAQSVEECREIAAMMPKGASFRINVATAFDCPFEGEMPAETTLRMVDELAAIAPDGEIALCDTTGRVTPDRVAALFTQVRARCARAHGWAFHGHDTYGMGVTNVWAAWSSGIDVIDASTSGLGGCPFAPGATGNVAMEDIAWMFGKAGVATGLNVGRLVNVARSMAVLPGAQVGGRVRDALSGQDLRAGGA